MSNVEDLMTIQKKDDFTFLTLLLKLVKDLIGPGDGDYNDDDDDDDYNDAADDERPSIGPGTPYPHPLHTGPTRGSRSAHFGQRICILDATKSKPSPDGGFIYATLWKL